MQQALGGRGAGTVVKAGVFGAISSSCSYAASALAKTLFARGATFTASVAFMFASTNLVIELGIVLWLLIGWQFALAEAVGGVIMIALLTVVLPRALPAAELDAARQRLRDSADDTTAEQDAQLVRLPWRERIRSRAGWSDAASYTVSDLTMLRKELVVGFLVAGFAEVLVPNSVWQSLFLTGHGFASSLENVVLGPFLAIISFVCSVGNVPLAAALWQGGISFGGVVAFVFADLITLPLLLIYRKYYGTRITLRLLGVFWATMSVAGLVTEYLFRALGIEPARTAGMTMRAGHDSFAWNYTAVLDIIALVVLAGLYWLYRNRARFGGGAGYAHDPVCGMQVEVAHAGARARHEGETFLFCSDGCRDAFVADPDRYVREPVSR